MPQLAAALGLGEALQPSRQAKKGKGSKANQKVQEF